MKWNDYMGVMERSYSKVVTNVFRAVNPIKKRIIKTECEVHKFINIQALEVLKNDGHIEAYTLLSQYINEINAGAVWADQDFKSSNHFFNPESEKGLYGRSDAQAECLLYYTKALSKYYNGDNKSGMYYFGASAHLIQDMTVPQHVNVRLLNQHRKYEQWVIKAYREHDKFKSTNGGIYLDAVKDYVKLNSERSMEVYKKSLAINDLDARFDYITGVILILAQNTTAGIMLKFYNDIEKMKFLYFS